MKPILFRASGIGEIMTDPKSKSETLSETCKRHCTEVFIGVNYNRYRDIENRYTIKGLQVEEDSMTLYSRHCKIFYKKNDQLFSNDFIKGTPDIVHGDCVVDVKSSWDVFTFFNSRDAKKLNKDYYWQLQAYMALTGAVTSKLVYCLVNTPNVLIADQKRRLSYKMGLIDADVNQDYVNGCAEIDRISIYDDIPMAERVMEIEVPRDEEAIARMYARVLLCREWINEHLFKAVPEGVAV